MTERHKRGVARVTASAALAVLLACGTGCQPSASRRAPVQYQEIALIQLESGFVPAEVTLVKGQPARLHITNAFDGTSTFTIGTLGINADLRHAELTQITFAAEQIGGLDGKKFTCIETGNGGTFHVAASGEETGTIERSGAMELAVVMTDDLAAPHLLVVKKDVPLKLYVTKTRGEEEDDTIDIPDWGIKREVEAGKVTEITYTPATAGDVIFMGTVTPSSRGIIRVID
jgi:plastocyanin domain-containing protein